VKHFKPFTNEIPTMRLNLIFLFLLISPSCLTAAAVDKRADVVFIVVDDLNDWVGVMGGHPQSLTPNFDRVARQGMLFTNAHCNAPQCLPSRTSFISGLYPKATGVYMNSGPRTTPRLTKPKGFPEHFKSEGYYVAMGGKVAYGKHPYLDAFLGNPSWPRPDHVPKLNAKTPPWDGAALPYDDEETGDYKVSQFAIEQWQTKTEHPVMMAIGLFRPHRPLWAPQKYFDKFPTATTQLPALPKGDDWDDLPDYAIRMARSHAHKDLHDGGKFSDHEAILNKNGETEWKRVVASYLANVNFMDAMLGRILKALEENPRGRKTMIVLTSDHGWNLGEKRHWCKGGLWKNTTIVPMVILAPGMTKRGTRSKQPVSLVDVYPTLCDLAGIDKPSHLQGTSMVPLLKDPKAKSEAAFVSYGPENTAIQTDRYRLIRYEDGSEELYDHDKDPHEWGNLAKNPEYSELKEDLKTSLLAFQNKDKAALIKQHRETYGKTTTPWLFKQELKK
jgi:arylsulfatase A-like enzyme